MSTEQPQEGGHKKPPIPTPAKRVPAYNIEKRGDRLYPGADTAQVVCDFEPAALCVHGRNVLQDYSREWKQYQREFNQLSVRNTVDDVLTAADSIDTAKRDELQKSLAAAEESEKQNNAQINEIEEQIASLNARWIRADQDYRFHQGGVRCVEVRLRRSGGAQGCGRGKEEDRSRTKRVKMLDKYFLEREEINTELQQAKDELAKLQGKSTEDRAATRSHAFRSRPPQETVLRTESRNAS